MRAEMQSTGALACFQFYAVFCTLRMMTFDSLQPFASSMEVLQVLPVSVSALSVGPGRPNAIKARNSLTLLVWHRGYPARQGADGAKAFARVPESVSAGSSP